MKPTLYLAAGAALAALFWAFPGLDQGAARLFYSPEGGFAQGQGLFARTVYASIPMLETALYIGLALAALARLIPAARRFHARWTVIVVRPGAGAGDQRPSEKRDRPCATAPDGGIWRHQEFQRALRPGRPV